MLARIGIATTAEAEPQSVFYTRMSRFDASLLLNGWGSIGDNLVVLRQALHSVDAARGLGGFNRGRYANAEVDRLTDAAAQTIDDGERSRLAAAGDGSGDGRCRAGAALYAGLDLGRAQGAALHRRVRRRHLRHPCDGGALSHAG
jgi:hypothetical protein